MSQAVTPDDLFKILRGYEDRMARLERANKLLADQMATADAGLAKKVPLVTAIPSSGMTDGDEIDLLIDTGANEIIWRLRYKPDSTSVYKWKPVGVIPYYNENLAPVAVPTAYPAVAHGPATPPLPAGWYRVIATVDVPRGQYVNGTIGIQYTTTSNVVSNVGLQAWNWGTQAGQDGTYGYAVMGNVQVGINNTPLSLNFVRPGGAAAHSVSNRRLMVFPHRVDVDSV